MKRITTPEERMELRDGRAHHLINEEAIKHVRFMCHVHLVPGDQINYHEHHGEYEVYYILKGKGIYSDNGEEKEVCAGMVTYCPSGNGHSMKNIGDETLEFVATIVVE